MRSVESIREVTTGQPNDPAFPARRCYGLLRALAGVPGLIVSVVSRDSPMRLDPSVGGPRPHDFRTRLVQTKASIASRATPRDDRDTPARKSVMTADTQAKLKQA